MYIVINVTKLEKRLVIPILFKIFVPQLLLIYIEKYAPLAVQQMKEHKIPASITLAQGLLESGAGQSALARKSNNHFGIKCGSNWHGRTVRHDDDARNECFRAYSNPRDS